MALSFEALVDALTKGSGYHHPIRDNPEYFHAESVQIFVSNDEVLLIKKYEYQGEEHMSCEEFSNTIQCTLPRNTFDVAFREMILKGMVTLPKVHLIETYSGRRGYGLPVHPITRDYDTTLEIRLAEGQQPIIGIFNPKEMHIDNI